MTPLLKHRRLTQDNVSWLTGRYVSVVLTTLISTVVVCIGVASFVWNSIPNW